MGIFNKKEEVPNISSAPVQNQGIVPQVPGQVEQPPITPVQSTELPSLPEGVGQNVNQEIVKSAVTDNNSGSMIPSAPTEGMQELPKDFKFESPDKIADSAAPAVSAADVTRVTDQNPGMQSSVMDGGSAPSTPTPSIETSALTEVAKQPEIQKPEEKVEDKIFVRIDKFQEAKKNLDDINLQVTKVESLANKIEQVKTEEVSELDQLGKDLDELKKKLASVDANIFQKL